MAPFDRLSVPTLLLIGSMGRNSGKTVLACKKISLLRASHPVIALKVSTIHTTEKRCLRGGEGCGVCTSLEGDFCITEELEESGGKDTARMLAAGAAKVYWLRALKDHLAEGFLAFLDMVDSSHPIVCESNSLGLIVEPGVFIMMKQKSSAEKKASADAVLDLADQIAEFDGEKLLFDDRRISFTRNGFSLRRDATLILLAGGASRRMGRAKSLLQYKGEVMIERLVSLLEPVFSEVIISANDPLPVSLPGAVIVSDRIPGLGPIGGICSSLAVASNEIAFVTACDIPVIHMNLLAEMLRYARTYNAVVPRTAEGHLEPLYA
ncbi:MAG: NTP transferase domain-containing protein, partial [Spirochaetales bacterium]|nr:NTP transferase domain-containing protein [Spirochaetales bacterium]